jgi:mRNA-degrading endonuclease RelE of RelBE toxin-antitoxin system
MIREIIQEGKIKDILKYLPKKTQKLVKSELEMTNRWIEAMEFPLKAGYYGYYGEKAGEKLEFNVKTYLEYDDEEALKIIGGDDNSDLDNFINDYYEMGREDLYESLKSEFGIEVYGYDGRSGGYILLEDYELALFGGIGTEDIYTDEDYIEEMRDYVGGVEDLLNDISNEGPLGDNFEDYVNDLEYMLDDGAPYDNNINKNWEKVVKSNYSKLEKFIEDSTKNFGKYFIEYLKDTMEGH